MRTDTPKTIYLKDYTPYPFKIENLDLNFDLQESYTLVTARTKFTPIEKQSALFLNGEDLELISIALNGKPLEKAAYTADDKGITITNPPAQSFTLEIVTKIYPEKNTRLEGLYVSGGNYCTQCEAEGFRRITYYPDRPDVLTTYTVRIEANKAKYPVLLSNGNKISDHPIIESSDKRHSVTWHDPFPKPCYLFALVAGDLAQIHDTYTTKSGRKVELYIYVRSGDEPQCDHAMESLKKSMKWEEETYGLEYDLDIFNIVAVSDFNMGAMENKSLNIFNTALVLAHPETATDRDFMQVESVIAHEYFHNWSGNRVTCRDWFQLSLKEGLTVFRDQEFSSDLHSASVQRIDDVAHLRRYQFPEDAGPLAHPIRPDNYIEINNFYTMTVYEKGAEIIRMIRTILGPENYRKGTDLYFSRHDGQAVTCEDFVKCMEDASGMDLKQFRLWYEQAGTPTVTAKGTYNQDQKAYTLELSQETPPTPGQKTKKPMHIPVAVGLLSENGNDLDLLSLRKQGSLTDGKSTEILHLTQNTQTFTFENIPSKPIPSILRNFSAPIKLEANLTDNDLAFLMVHDSDGFNRWEAGQNYALRTLLNMMDKKGEVPTEYIRNYGDLLDRALDPKSDKALMARMMYIPEIAQIGQHCQIINPQTIYETREKLLNTLLKAHEDKLNLLYTQNLEEGTFEITAAAMGKRALKNSALLMLSNRRTEQDAFHCIKAYDNATNMTDRMAALMALVVFRTPECETAIQNFYEKFKSFPLAIDKWFSAQSMAVRNDTLKIINNLLLHSDFNIKNPNRVRSVYASFAINNPVCFHASNGSGYTFLQEAIIKLNTINPQIAARLLTPMREWRRYTPDRQEKMKSALEQILKAPSLAPDVFEIASKSLKDA